MLTYGLVKTDSTLIKKYLHIRDEIVAEKSTTTTSSRLVVWFTQTDKEVDRAYEYFRRTRSSNHR